MIPVGHRTQATGNSLGRRSKSSLQHLAWRLGFVGGYAARVNWHKMVELIDDIAAQAELTLSFCQRFSIQMCPQSIHRAAKSTRS